MLVNELDDAIQMMENNLAMAKEMAGAIVEASHAQDRFFARVHALSRYAESIVPPQAAPAPLDVQQEYARAAQAQNAIQPPTANIKTPAFQQIAAKQAEEFRHKTWGQVFEEMRDVPKKVVGVR